MNEKGLGSPMEDLLNLGKQVLSSQPFSVYVGTEMLSFTQGSVELKIPIRHELKQQHGFVHGGVISYAADNALTFAGGSVLGPGVTTSEFKINYLRPAIGDFWLRELRSYTPARARRYAGATCSYRKTAGKVSVQLLRALSQCLADLQMQRPDSNKHKRFLGIK